MLSTCIRRSTRRSTATTIIFCCSWSGVQPLRGACGYFRAFNGPADFTGRHSSTRRREKLGNVRRAYVEQEDPLLNAAVGFRRGGARLFREGKELSGSTVNDLTAKAMQIIFDDEHDHYMEQAKEAISHIKSPKLGA